MMIFFPFNCIFCSNFVLISASDAIDFNQEKKKKNLLLYELWTWTFRISSKHSNVQKAQGEGALLMPIFLSINWKQFLFTKIIILNFIRRFLFFQAQPFEFVSFFLRQSRSDNSNVCATCMRDQLTFKQPHHSRLSVWVHQFLAFVYLHNCIFEKKKENMFDNNIALVHFLCFDWGPFIPSDYLVLF